MGTNYLLKKAAALYLNIRKLGATPKLSGKTASLSVEEQYHLLGESAPYRLLLQCEKPKVEDEAELRRDPVLFCAMLLADPETLGRFLPDCEALKAKHATRKSLGDALHKAFFAPEQLSLEDLPLIEGNDTSLIALQQAGTPRLFELLGEKYALPPAIVQFLMGQDLKTTGNVTLGIQRGNRFETFRDRAIGRLAVAKKNFNALEEVTRRFQLRRHAYFDVGCLFGLSMVSAAQLGYKFADGCELDEKVFARAQWITEWMRENSACAAQYFEQDFVALELPAEHYTLVTVNNVLEHTPDLEGTVAQIAKILAQDGIAYIYQGNGRSPAFVRVEPHYKLPLISILPKDLTIAILMRLGLIENPEDYVVTAWPEYESLRELFQKYELQAEFHAEKFGFNTAASKHSKLYLSAIGKAIALDAEAKIYPCLSGEERAEVSRIAEEYFAALGQLADSGLGPEKIPYVDTTWVITLRKTPT